ncbi:MAG: addiction module antitoxin [Bacteroidetes bacterium CG12_big_fil_rev_8_21_14_0_65_60_17]|nr:MAG: addiction module antitoxin [Bacteroidetes bacterium CG12_big_fil_rev_8_21_14_0_65_60_17]
MGSSSSVALRKRINERIQGLATDPRPQDCEKLSGRPCYRIRQDDYRIVYEIKDDVLLIHIMKVGHRKDINRK